MKMYHLILMDPPWDYKEKNYHRVPLKYPTLTYEHFKQFPINFLIDINSIVCMWAIGAKLDEAFDLLSHWGLKFVIVLFVYSKAYKHQAHKL